jgi:hypothetical protein
MNEDQCHAAECGNNHSIRFMFNEVVILLCTKHIAQLAIVLIEKSELPSFQHIFNEGVIAAMQYLSLIHI